jgi:hypothetical protein
VLEAPLAGIRHLRRTDGVGHVAREGDAELLRLVGDREHCVPGDERLELDEVGPALLHLPHGAPAVLRRRDRDRAREARLLTVEHRSAQDDARTGERSLRDLLPPAEQLLELAAHVAHAGDAVGEEQGKRDLLPAGEPVAEGHVDVHVPEPGDQVAALALHDAGAFRNRDRARRADVDDPLAFHDDGRARLKASRLHVHDRHVTEDEGRSQEERKEERAHGAPSLPHASNGVNSAAA